MISNRCCKAFLIVLMKANYLKELTTLFDENSVKNDCVE